jgi:CHAT domain-containing protein/tetratricopeptide (TPR) repeat protein
MMTFLDKRSGAGITGILLAVIAVFSFPNAQGPKEVSPQSLLKKYHQEISTAESLWRGGYFEEAFVKLNEARELARRMEDSEKEIQCAILLGKLCWVLGRPEDSEKFYAGALKRASNLGLKKETEEARTALKILELYSQGKADRFARRYEKSIQNFNAAIQLARQIGSQEHEAKCLRQLSFAYLDKQDAESFLFLNKKALEIARELKDQGLQAKSLINVGLYYFRLIDYSRALNSYSDALDLARSTHNREDESLCLKNISLILMNLGMYERSLDYLQAACDIDRQIGNTNFLSRNMNTLGEAFRNLGLIFSNKEDLAKALKYFTEAFDSAKKNGDQQMELISMNNIGNVHRDLENYETALNFLRPALEAAEKAGEGEAQVEILTNMGICSLKTGNFQQAQRYFQKAVERGGEIGAEKLLWEPLFYLGQCQEHMKADGLALDCYRDSIAAIDHIRSHILADSYKVGFGKNKTRVYESLISLLYRLYKNEATGEGAKEIFSAVEKAKARAFLESLGELKNDFRSQLNLPLKKREGEISTRISSLLKEMSQGALSRSKMADLQDELKQSEDEYLRLIARMRTEAPEVADMISPLPVGVEQVQERLLDEKTAVLEYFLGDGQSFLFSLTKKGFSFFPLPPKNELEKSIAAYTKFLSEPPKGEWRGRPAAERLSRVLLSAALKTLPASVERLVIIPDGLLYYLPFETLALFPQDQSSGEDFLISKYDVSYAPSCSSLLLLNERKKKERYPKILLAFGNPLYPSDSSLSGKRKISLAGIMKETYEGQGFDFSSLAQSKQEIKEISRLFGKNDRDVYLGKDACEETVKKIRLGDYQIIHFACHGFLDEKMPFRSALVLSSAEDDKEDGFLQAREIANLHLAAELVVLSACQTGRGYMEKGEGILGLTRTFFYAGARSVVSALWEIGDKATAELMGQFYYHLSRENGKARALRLAKLSLLKTKYAHPFYWAGFVLHGEFSSALVFD